jgi:hypothetical protein
MRWSMPPLALGDVSLRSVLLRGNEVISQCKTTAMQKRLLSPPADERHGAMWDMALGERLAGGQKFAG